MAGMVHIAAIPYSFDPLCARTEAHRPLLLPPHSKRPHQHRQRHLRRLPPVALPLPKSLKGGAASKVVNSLIAKGLIEEVDAKLGEPMWRETGDGHGVTLAVTNEAFEALGIETGAEAQAETNKTAGRQIGDQEKGSARRAHRQQTGAADRHAEARERREHR